MNSLNANQQEPHAYQVSVTDEALTLDLVDGRTIRVPLVWYPRLWLAIEESRR